MGKLLLFKNEQGSRNVFPSLDCIFMNIKSTSSNKKEKNNKNEKNKNKPENGNEGPSDENIGKYIPSIFTSHPSAPLAGGASPPDPLPGDNSFPNGNSSHVTSVNEIHEDQDFDPYVEQYASTSWLKTIGYNAFFYIFDWSAKIAYN